MVVSVPRLPLGMIPFSRAAQWYPVFSDLSRFDERDRTLPNSCSVDRLGGFTPPGGLGVLVPSSLGIIFL